MPSSSEPRSGRPSVERALLEKIEALSILRALNDRLGRAPGFVPACRTLVDLLWQERMGDVVAYVSVDLQRSTGRLEALASPDGGSEPAREIGLSEPPLPALIGGVDPVAIPGAIPPPWLGLAPAGGPLTLLSVPTRIRDATTGVLLVYTDADPATCEETRRLLAILATQAALALDAARAEAREEFLAMLRHDISNPVSSALGFSEIILERLRTGADAELTGYAGSVLESLEVVADLVANYLNMAVIDRGGPWLERTTLDLGALAREGVAWLAPQAAHKDVALTCEGASPHVYADRRQLGRVLTNLLSNAIKYTPPGGRIQVAVTTEPTAAALVVSDTGYGLSEQDLGRLFTKYARFHRDRGIPGSGLGLYLTKAIVEAHGGTIEVASRPGEGSTFTVRLPLAS